MKRSVRVAAVAASLALSACGSDDVGPGVGDPLPDIEMAGYVSTGTTGLASDGDFGPARFADVRDRAAVSHAVVHVSGFT